MKLLDSMNCWMLDRSASSRPPEQQTVVVTACSAQGLSRTGDSITVIRLPHGCSDNPTLISVRSHKDTQHGGILGHAGVPALQPPIVPAKEGGVGLWQPLGLVRARTRRTVCLHHIGAQAGPLVAAHSWLWRCPVGNNWQQAAHNRAKQAQLSRNGQAFVYAWNATTQPTTSPNRL